MKRTLLIALSLSAMLTSCSTQSVIERVREVPLKGGGSPGMETGLLRTQSTYLLRGAITTEEIEARLGQYYFVTWQDSHPAQRADVVMSYQQSANGSRVLQKTISYPGGRKKAKRKDIFSFIGEEHRRLGEVLSWRIDLKLDGRIVSTRRSYLWRDDHTTSGEFQAQMTAAER